MRAILSVTLAFDQGKLQLRVRKVAIALVIGSDLGLQKKPESVLESDAWGCTSAIESVHAYIILTLGGG